MKPISLRVAEELGVREQQVAAAVALLDGGATVPFVARYRKEATGALDDTSRETDRLGAELIRLHPELELTKVVVSEAGASVYSASALASEELPGLDVSLRGAVSIARRLQDPLAELVKIDPQSIGVGQYQHDLSEHKLSRSLNAVVEDCVNAWGLTSTRRPRRCCRESPASAKDWRTALSLTKVPRLGPKAFELSAGFLRIRNGDDPLDASGVHPEAYPVVRRILAATRSELKRLIGDRSILRQLQPEAFTDAMFGVPTVTDILRELEKPGRDPRPAFKTANFRARSMRWSRIASTRGG